MAERAPMRVTLNLRLLETETHKPPEGLPQAVVYGYDRTGQFLASTKLARAPNGALQGQLEIPATLEGQFVRLVVAPAPRDPFAGLPSWMVALTSRDEGLGGNQSTSSAKGPAKQAPLLGLLLRQPGVREKRIPIVKDLATVELALYPHDWLQWLFCPCVVRGRLIKRLSMPDGTTRELGVCHACVKIYEVDAFPLVILRLPEPELYRLRDDLWRAIRRPGSLPEEVTRPLPKPPPVEAAGLKPPHIADLPLPTPEPPDLWRVADLPLPTPEPTDLRNVPEAAMPASRMEAELATVLNARSGTALRQALIAQAGNVVQILCFVPWLYQWFDKDLIRCVCTDEQGRFETTVWYRCAGDKPDLYFSAVQCIDGSLHTLYDPGIVCHTYWNYECGTEVVLETTDPAARVCVHDDPVIPPPGLTPWVMPWGVGGTLLNCIKQPSGLTDYQHDSESTIDAPFGSTLGFRHGYASQIPSAAAFYYRWQYRRASGAWHEFTASVVRHYVDEDLSDPTRPPTFPAYPLGPNSINGLHLYEFRPSQPPQVPGHNRYWPTDNWFDDIYSGFLISNNLPGGVDASAGEYQIKLEVYDQNGNRVTPGSVFRFIVPIGIASDKVSVLTREALASEMDGDGFVFYLHIDNRPCSALVDAPTANGTPASDNCGFLQFKASDNLHISFHAQHAANFATFAFWIRRGIQIVSSAMGEVSAATAPYPTPPAAALHSYTGDGSGNFAKNDFAPAELLGICEQAAFAEILRTYAKATNGWHRLHAYDAAHERAFALSPKKP